MASKDAGKKISMIMKKIRPRLNSKLAKKCFEEASHRINEFHKKFDESRDIKSDELNEAMTV